MNITDQSSKVLSEIDHKITLALGFSDLLLFKSLRCLKTAIEGLLEIYKYDSGNGCCDYGCDTPTIAENLLITIITEWNENK